MQGGKSEGDMSVTRKTPYRYFFGGPKSVVSNVSTPEPNEILKMFADHNITLTFFIFYL